MIRKAKAMAYPIGAVALVAALSLVASLTLAVEDVRADDCPNAEFRVGPSKKLPDCRAYEQVSPVDKNGGEVGSPLSNPRHRYSRASIDGNRIVYPSHASFAGAQNGLAVKDYLATRGDDGWTTNAISPPFTSGITDVQDDLTHYSNFVAFSDDLTDGWLLSASAKQLAPGAGASYANLYRTDVLSDGYETLTTGEPFGPHPLPFNSNKLNVWFAGAAEDGEPAILTAVTALTPDAPTNAARKVYAYAEGELRLVSVLPDGTPTSEWASAGTTRNTLDTDQRPHFGTRAVHNVISDDGSRVFWTEGIGTVGTGFRSPGPVYMRVDPMESQSEIGIGGECLEPGKACTTLISRDSASIFLTAAPDGSRALLMSGNELYLVDTESTIATSIGTGVLGGVGGTTRRGLVGSSEDLDYVYFVSSDDLDGAGAGAAGDHNFYVSHSGSTSLIAKLSDQDVLQGLGQDTPSLIAEKPRFLTGRVTADGHHVAFTSSRSLTGYDNRDVESDIPAIEVFVYDAIDEELTCASCNPSGARPRAVPLRRPYGETGSSPLPTDMLAAASLPTTNDGLYSPRALSDDGARLYFESDDALVKGDANGVQDVYQWEASGSGSCAQPGGCVSLISTGSSGAASEFVDASPDGRDVFFLTASSIHPDDREAVDLYNARAAGGIPTSSLSVPCTGDECQPSGPAPPMATESGSSQFHGSGNQAASAGCDRLRRQAGRRARQADQAAVQARKAKKRAKRASGEAAKRLGRKAAAATRRARVKRQRAERGKRKLARCERAVG